MKTGTEHPMNDKTNGARPLILDLGKRKRKQVTELRRGEGQLMADVLETLDQLRTAGTLGLNAQPVIVVVREKAKRSVFWDM
jgi:hypothetical protein